MDLNTIRGSNPQWKQAPLMKVTLRVVRFMCFCLLMFSAIVVQAQEPSKAPPKKPEPGSSPMKMTSQPVPAQKIVEQGIAIEFTIDPHTEKATKLRAGEDANVKFKVTDTTSSTPIKGLNLSAWISLRSGDKAADPKQCREKIQSYLTGSMRARPDVDLNSYYILALNGSPDISVIDPLLSFGGSKLLDRKSVV